jgi:CMP/dCMP kinase
VTVVAIDGPAGAGKSTVARAVADRLSFTYLDTGAMYRAVAFTAAERGRAPAAIAAELRIEPGERIRVDGRDVSDEIRTPEVSEAASRAASDPAVRSAVAAQQRRLLETGDWVAEGRDIGTVVAPDAEVKVFLTADPAERAIRDERDSTREHSPLQPAPGAVVIDSTDMTLPEVVERIAALALGASGV